MLALRVSVPAALTEPVLAVLTGATAVTGLAVLRGASLSPEGDVVTADVAREGANAVVDALRDLGVHEEGTVRLTPVPTWLSREAYAAERRAPGAGADAVVWTQVTHRAYEDSELNWVYLSFMVLATLIAGVAVAADNLVLVVGAMVLGPEFGPIAAVGLALVLRRAHLFGLAVRTLLAGFAAGIGVTWAAALVARALGWVSAQEVTHGRTLTSFVAHPDHWSLVVAVIAGSAGVLSLTSGRTRGLAGVFISVVTVPAAGNIAVAAAVGAWGQVWSAGAQLAVNLVGMAAAGWATLVVQRVLWSRVSPRRATMMGRPPL
ncbi:DUF389 domain-containing protein [Phycicoccus endophyticus]|uniref:DUF389 domain-containing protein n=1 Tax=Phycicoccus endophyticus TaxID=1690220 RepID=A0A7G9R3K4_9MICO|nr:DUF389 domain-containing protein [Phycicoccus endophyticus]NHI19936.1 DUF389 domain-containing protein [Phycicoccus endophyticus]QNN50179.1 DUF389 domain-containing protein [Phycicoccus endophyticus]